MAGHPSLITATYTVSYVMFFAAG